MSRYTQETNVPLSDGYSAVRRRKDEKELNQDHSPDPLSEIYALKREGRVGDAVSMCRRLLALQPDHVDLLFIQAELQQTGGHVDAAIDTYRHVLALEPTSVEAEYNLGLLYQHTGAHESASDCYRRAVDLDPGFAAAYTNLGALLMDSGRLDEAATCYAIVTRIEPESAWGYINSGRCLFKLGRYADAASCFNQAAALNPNSAPAWHNLGLAYQRMRCWNQALQSLKRALKLSPQNAELYFAVGNVYLDQANMAAVIDWYRRGVARDPENMEHQENLALLLHGHGAYREALDCYRKIIRQAPDSAEAHFNAALLLLRCGHFHEGWAEYEWRLRQDNWDKGYPWQIDKPRWHGKNFENKTLLVHCEQGFGDCLQFARYLPLVKARGGTVVFEVPAAMSRLFEGFPGVDKLWTLSATSPPEDSYDIHVPLLSLPYIFGTTLDSIPDPVPHLYEPEDHTSDGRQVFRHQPFRVGIVWAGSKVHVNDRNRSCTLGDFITLIEGPEIEWISLQTEIDAEQIRAEDPAGVISYWGDRLIDFRDTAAALMSIDLVITVDTATAHLAATMGKPTWILLPYVPDWRWQVDRNDCPWYPSVRLFRQQAPADWASVFANVSEALDQFLKMDRKT